MPANSRHVLDQLQRYESRNVTYLDPDGTWPIVWERARGCQVWDAAGRRYLDLTAAFGVAAAGHANPRVVAAGQSQMGKLLHAMGDVHPHALKAQLARELSRLTFERWTRARPKSKQLTGKVIFGSAGFEAVEAALKTALLATGRRGVVAFHGSYHGLGYGALNATQRDHFRSPFRTQLREFGHFAPYPKRPAELAAVAQYLKKLKPRAGIGAIIVEPVQGRGGNHVPPAGFLPLLRRWCDQHGALLILDEIYTGFGRTGKWFAAEHTGVVPDLICLGKALTGGFPLSACVGKTSVMDAAWPPSQGEAIHTSTYLGHPVGCAMALAQLKELEAQKLISAAAVNGRFLLDQLRRQKWPITGLRVEPRGLGMMVGVELLRPDGQPATEAALSAVKRLLHRGYIFLPEGEAGNVISFTPPLTISLPALARAVTALYNVLAGK